MASDVQVRQVTLFFKRDVQAPGSCGYQLVEKHHHFDSFVKVCSVIYDRKCEPVDMLC